MRQLNRPIICPYHVGGHRPWVETRILSNPSDYQEVVLCLRDLGTPRQHDRRCPVIYPINASHPDQVITESVENMDGMAIG